jgi:two-component system chemotaxis response regulator CheB
MDGDTVMNDARIRTLIVENSTFVRTLLRTAMAGHADIEVIGFAGEGSQAQEMIQSLRPDVIVIDIELAGFSGIELPRDLVGSVPAGVVAVSDLSRGGAEATLEALDKGVFDYVVKPRKAGLAGVPRFREALCERVIAAARARNTSGVMILPGAGGVVSLPADIEPGWLVAMGIGCGGPRILMRVLPMFPKDFPPILVAQHMPALFTRVFAERLGRVCEMAVREAVQDDRVEQGTILIAPGGLHMEVGRNGQELLVQLDNGPRVWGHRPSIDMLFNSVARECGSKGVGVLMTGTGHDGVAGLSGMKRAGAWTLTQTETTGSATGRPGAGARSEAVEHQVDLQRIPYSIAQVMRAGCRVPALTA